MSESSSRIVLTRRQALLLSASAGVGIAASKSGFASDSVKTAAHDPTAIRNSRPKPHLQSRGSYLERT
jgi:hypothetical protein